MEGFVQGASGQQTPVVWGAVADLTDVGMLMSLEGVPR